MYCIFLPSGQCLGQTHSRAVNRSEVKGEAMNLGLLLLTQHNSVLKSFFLNTHCLSLTMLKYTLIFQTKKHPHRPLAEFFPQCQEFRPVEMTCSFALIGEVKVTYRSPNNLFKRAINQHGHTHTPHTTEIRHWQYSKLSLQILFLLSTSLTRDQT